MAQPQGASGSKKRPKFMDVLEQVSDSDPDASGSSSSSESEDEGAGPAPEQKKQKITFEDLEQRGYKTGPSVIYMKAPQEQQEENWNWSSGKERRGDEASEDEEERERTRHAVTKGVAESAEFAQRAAAHAAKLREEGFAEKQKLAEEKRLSFNQKEKKKRDKGQVSRGKNYVEEEKRLARQFNQYSGFD